MPANHYLFVLVCVCTCRSGLNPNWHLELVSVTDLATKITYWFECNKWFDISQGDGKIERVLRASLTPPVPPNKPELERTAPYQVSGCHPLCCQDADSDFNVSDDMLVQLSHFVLDTMAGTMSDLGRVVVRASTLCGPNVGHTGSV